MIEVNGTSLSSTEYRELEGLVESDDPARHAANRLRESRELSSNCDDVDAIYGPLARKRLIAGRFVSNEFAFVRLNQRGRDFVSGNADLVRAAAGLEEKRLREMRESRAHDYKVAAFSFLGGAVSGAITTILLHFALGL